jgi:hypothetical protein
MANNQPLLLETFLEHEARLQKLFKTNEIEWEFLQTWFKTNTNQEYQKSFKKVMDIYNLKIVLSNEFGLQERGSLSWSEYTKFNLLMGDVYRNIKKLIDLYIIGG